MKILSRHLPKFITLILYIGVFGFLFANPVFANFNSQINYQGKLTATNGSAVSDGTYSITFNLYTVPTAGSSIWTETNLVIV